MADLLRVLGVAALLACISCEGREPLPLYPVRSGHYESRGAGTVLWSFPHGEEPKTMDVDREAGTVRITYTRDGSEVVEIWRITATTEYTSM